MTTEERLECLFTEARRREAQPPRARFSNAAGCIRQHVYDELACLDGKWSPEEDVPVRWNAAAACGHAIGALLEDAAGRLGAQTQVAAAIDREGQPGSGLSYLQGTADIVWPEAVWDLKCVGDHAWYKAKRGPDQKHVVQVNGYSYALGKPRWALIYVYLGSIGKGRTLQYLHHEGETDPELAREIVNHWLLVRDFAFRRELPVRPYPDATGFECGVCRYHEQCWTGDNE